MEMGASLCPTRNADGLVGASIKVNISIEDIPDCALLDASAIVSVMSQLLYEKTRVTCST